MRQRPAPTTFTAIRSAMTGLHPDHLRAIERNFAPAAEALPPSVTTPMPEMSRHLPCMRSTIEHAHADSVDAPPPRTPR